MMIRRFFLTTLFSVVISSLSIAQYEFEWSVDNTLSNSGERIIAIIDAGSIGTYDGIGIIGEVIDDNGNWGQALPSRSDFQMFLKFSGQQDYGIAQESATLNIILRLRKVSNSVYHFTANCPSNHKSISVKFDRVITNGIETFTLGNPNVVDSTGELVISEPTYESNFDGKVGIGTANPDHELTVKGKIHAEEILVDLNVPGPDYVFEADYDLPTLGEIEVFIKANKHLPEVPPAARMEEEGITLGEMNMLLLKKIEELTLHTINQQKLIEGTLEQNKSLTEKNQELAERIEQLENKSESNE